MTFTEEEVKQLLGKYYRYKEQIEYLDREIEKLETRATKRTQTFTPDPNTTPINNPRPSKVEKNAIKVVELEEKKKDVQTLLDTADKLLDSLMYRRKYLVKCVICNGMKIKDFAKREGLPVKRAEEQLKKAMDQLVLIEI